MAIQFNEIPGNLRVPFMRVEFNAGQAPYASIARLVLIGQKTAAGTAEANKPVWVTGGEDGLFGAGSMLACMYKIARKNGPFQEIWAVPLSDAAASTAATGTITVGGTFPVTVAGTIVLYINDQRVTVPGVDDVHGGHRRGGYRGGSQRLRLCRLHGRSGRGSRDVDGGQQGHAPQFGAHRDEAVRRRRPAGGRDVDHRPAGRRRHRSEYHGRAYRTRRRSVGLGRHALLPSGTARRSRGVAGCALEPPAADVRTLHHLHDRHGGRRAGVHRASQFVARVGDACEQGPGGNVHVGGGCRRRGGGASSVGPGAVAPASDASTQRVASSEGHRRPVEYRSAPDVLLCRRERIPWSRAVPSRSTGLSRRTSATPGGLPISRGWTSIRRLSSCTACGR